jgi:hypothetical protein
MNGGDASQRRWTRTERKNLNAERDDEPIAASHPARTTPASPEKGADGTSICLTWITSIGNVLGVVEHLKFVQELGRGENDKAV